jgi:metal-dependent amidase/aminoacylase/carboxypeptidase family protein
MTVDVVTLAAQVVAELPGRVAARIAHLDHDQATLVKVVFGAIHAGDAANVIPTHCVLKASIRTPSLPVWDELPEVFAQELRSLVAGSGAELDLDYTHGVPPVVNDAAITDIVGDAAATAFGASSVETVEQSWGGDDFAWFTREVPGTYVRLGVRTPGGPTLDLHAGHFDVDERAIAIGVRLLTATVERYFAERTSVGTGS